MDAVSFAIGLSGIIAVVEKSFSIWQSISETKHFGNDMMGLITQLSMEYFRFYTWAEVSGLYTEEPSTNLVPSTTTRITHAGLMATPILDAAAQFVAILEDVAKIVAKYKPSQAEVATSGESSATATTSTLSSRLPVFGAGRNSVLASRIAEHGDLAATLQKGTSFRRRFTFASRPWGRPDREELKSKIAELCYWNDRLEGLLSKEVRVSLASQAAPGQILVDENRQALQQLLEAPEPLSEPLRGHARLWSEGIAISDISPDDAVDANRLISTYRRDLTCLETVTGVGHTSSSSQLSLRKYTEKVGGDGQSYVTAPSLTVVEWYSYPSSMETTEGLRMASARLAGLVRLTSMKGLPSTLHILNGVCFVESGNSLGLVYKLPANAHPTKQPVSLFSLISRTDEVASDFRPPPLEARIRLGQQLASSLHSFGLARWFHKDFNCRNVVFFRSKLASANVMLDSPYITGFSISRPDAQDEQSLNKDHEDLSVYLHPDLRTRDPESRPKYERKYDIYSLGLVLLELGFWRTLSSLVKSNLSPADFKAQVVRRCQKDLAFFTGSAYRDIALRCLICADDGFDGAASSLDSFYFSVVLELVKICSVSGT